MSLFVQAIVDGVRLMVSLNCCSIKTATITQSLRSVLARAGRWARWGCRGQGGRVQPHRAWRGHVTWRSTAAPTPPARLLRKSSMSPSQLRVKHNTITKVVCARERSNLENAVEHMGPGRQPQNTSPDFAGPQRSTAPPGARRELASRPVWECGGARGRPRLGQGDLPRVQCLAAQTKAPTASFPPSTNRSQSAGRRSSCYSQPVSQKMRAARL